MALGDSITGYCYPQDLSLELTTNGHTNFTFIGTQTNNHGDCTKGAPATLKTESHGGYGVTYLPANTTRTPNPCTKQSQGCGSYAELQTWAAEKPDIVLMLYGTNDVWDGISSTTILSAYTAVLTEFRKQNPNVIFFVGQLIPLNPSSSCCEASVESLNALIPGWATGQSTAASPVYVVNVWSAINPTTYVANSTFTNDGVHPNPVPSQAMADKWYAALIAHGLP
jgi:mannan endo-1,4-beta-mannosidase